MPSVYREFFGFTRAAQCGILKGKGGSGVEIIWDFDGTLFDTYPLMARCLQRALADAGQEAGYEEIRAQMAVSLAQAFQHFGAAEATIARYRQYIQEAGPQGVAPYPGAAEALARVQQAGGHNHIFTHRGSSTRWYLREHGLLDRFSLLVTSEDGLPRKPEPDGILRILQRSGAPREAFAMVGDREIDVLAAHNAGILACRFAPEEPDVSTEAEIVLTDLRDILKAIEEERTK